MRLKADLTLLLVAVIWGTAFVAQRIAAVAGSVFLFNGFRFLIGMLVLLPFTGLRWGFSRRDWLVASLAGGILFLASALQQAGVQFTTAGNAGFITSLYVVLVPVILLFGWRERPHWTSWLAVVLASVGAFLLSTGGEFVIRAGDALELVGALFWAGHVVVVGKYGARADPVRFAAGQFLVASVLNLAAGAIFENVAFTFNWPVMGAIAYTGILSVGVGYTLQVVAQQHTPPTDAALILSLEAVVAVLAGWLILDEQLLALQMLGCVLIFAGVLLAQAREFKKDSGN